jgi:arylsulfatase A-like enzyme
MKFALCLGFIVCLSLKISAAPSPNVLVIMADDLGWGDLSANGNREIQTPHLDKFGKSGLRFDKFYVCPTGATTSASLLTGRYHYRTGVSGEAGLEAMMHSSEKTIAEVFRENNFQTAYFGHWPHGDNWPHLPTAQGFTIFSDTTPVADTITFLKQSDPAPFFCLTKIPYPQIANSPEITDAQRSGKIKDGITTLDNEIGTILHVLSSTKKDLNTLVIFLSDNGPDQFGAKTGRFNGYLLGGKGSVHEGGVRVPCFASWPGHIAENSRFSKITAHLDWFPTLCEICQLQSTSRQPPLDGTSLAPALFSSDSTNWPNRILFTSWTPPGYDLKNASVSVRTDRWLALRDPRWSRNQSPTNHWELYDLKTDPFQTRDLGNDHPFLLGELKADFAFWINDTTDDGIGPIPIQIGFPEWPEVTFYPNTPMTWPIQVEKSGNYTAQIDFPANVTQCVLSVGQKSWILPAENPIQLFEDDQEIKISSGHLTRLRLTHNPEKVD